MQVGHPLSEVGALGITSQDSGLIQMLTAVDALSLHADRDALVFEVSLGTDSARLCGSYWSMS